MQNIDWNILSRHRSSLMGVAILLILAFHSFHAWNEITFLKTFGCGDFGVEIFVFLSAVGLSRSMSGGPSLASFYGKRLLRIMPAFCAVAVPMALIRHFSFGASWTHVAVFSLGLSYFRGEWTYWFISFILFCYFWTPFLYTLKRKMGKPFVLFLSALAVSLALHFVFKEELSYWNTLVVRFPVFVLGLEMADFILKGKDAVSGGGASGRVAASLVTLLLAACVLYFIRPLPDDIRYYIYLVLTVPFCLAASCLMEKLPRLDGVLGWIGGITLELYVLHQHVCIPAARHITDVPVPACLLALVLAFVGAKLLSLAVGAVIALIRK